MVDEATPEDLGCQDNDLELFQAFDPEAVCTKQYAGEYNLAGLLTLSGL